jgi:hypothetical protein
MAHSFHLITIIASAVLIPFQKALVYEQDFKQGTHTDFAFTDESAWRVHDGSLELFAQSAYTPPYRSPFNIALLRTKKVGSFTLEADVMQTGREYGHRDMCIFFGFQNTSQFYYIHIASIPDEAAHNVFIVNNAPRTNFAHEVSDGIDWEGGWHKIRLERNIDTGLIRLYFDDMTVPIMEARNTRFREGYIGFGSFDDTGKVDNIKLWANTSTDESILPFK